MGIAANQAALQAARTAAFARAQAREPTATYLTEARAVFGSFPGLVESLRAAGSTLLQGDTIVLGRAMVDGYGLHFLDSDTANKLATAIVDAENLARQIYTHAQNTLKLADDKCAAALTAWNGVCK